MRNRVPHLSLLTQFSILSLLCVVALGAALVLVLRDQIHDRAAANSRGMAQNIANDIADEHVTGRDLERGLGKRKMDAIDRSIEVLVLRGRIRTAKIYDLQGRIVYSFNRREVGRADLSEEVQLALEGHTQAAFEGAHESFPGTGRVYEVYVPLRLLGDDGPAGVFEVYMPYAPIAAQIDKDSRRLYPVLIAGLALLYLVLFPIVARASRKLRRHAETSHHQALHDDLTGVANRRQLQRRLEHEIKSASAVERSFALLMLDLDRFKEVNDALGHGHGDRLLRDVAARLGTTVRQGDLLARLGGDEFALLLADVSGPRRRDRGRWARQGRPARRVRARWRAVARRGERRHRALPRARPRRRDAPAVGRHRHVRRQALAAPTSSSTCRSATAAVRTA